MINLLWFELIFFEILSFFNYWVDDMIKRFLGIIFEVVEYFPFRIDDNLDFLRKFFDQENIEILNTVNLFIEIIGKEVLRNDFVNKKLWKRNDVFFEYFFHWI